MLALRRANTADSVDRGLQVSAWQDNGTASHFRMLRFAAAGVWSDPRWSESLPHLQNLP
jgi:hypothetical protein